MICLLGCQENMFCIKNNKLSSHNSKVYEFNTDQELNIEIYEVINNEWKLIHTNILPELANQDSQLVICLHELNRFESKEYQLQYYTIDKNDNELRDVFSLDITIDQSISSFKSTNETQIKKHDSKKWNLVYYCWDNYAELPRIQNIDTNVPLNVNKAYLVKISS